jgi:hypothetical protein
VNTIPVTHFSDLYKFKHIGENKKMTRTSEPDFEAGTLNPYVIEGEEIQEEDRFGYKIIAKVMEYGWCAYKGPTGWDDEKVAAYGDEVDKKVAVILFPTVDAVMKSVKKPYRNY